MVASIPAKFSDKLPFHPLSFILLILLTIILYKWLFNVVTTTQNPSKRRRPPPSPPKLPIIGNLHQLGKLPHRNLASLSHRYGRDLMLLQLGTKPAIVVSSPEAAREIMKTQDMVFTDRPKLKFVDKILYDGKAVVFAPYGEYWRHMRSIVVTQLLSNNKVQSFRNIREQEVALMVQKIKKNSGFAVNLSGMIFGVIIDVVSRTNLGKKYEIDFGEQFKGLPQVVGAISVGDYIPWLGCIDRVTGLEGRADDVRKRVDDFVNRVYQDHLKGLMKLEGGDVGRGKDFVDVLLQVQREDPGILCTDSIKAVLLDIFGAATETTSSLLEWAMSELIKHPRVMKKLQEEVRGIVKSENKQGVTEDDLENMKYLKATLKEILRLHPPTPILILRESSRDVEIKGYDIGAGTIVIINAWAIQRDPTCWENPNEFIPERFLNSTVDFKGQHFEFIPFGAGRRGCPGISYAMVTAELVLASLVYEFDWKLPFEADHESLDMTECEGFLLSIHRQHPLMVIATPHSY